MLGTTNILHVELPDIFRMLLTLRILGSLSSSRYHRGQFDHGYYDWLKVQEAIKEGGVRQSRCLLGKPVVFSAIPLLFGNPVAELRNEETAPGRLPKLEVRKPHCN